MVDSWEAEMEYAKIEALFLVDSYNQSSLNCLITYLADRWLFDWTFDIK